MDHFRYQHAILHAEAVDLNQLAETVGTPFYCYSRATLERHYRVFAEGLSGLDAQICYAVKANSNLSVLKTLALLGSGADVVSEGEIRRALAAGILAEKIVFSGVGKQHGEMAYALQQQIWQFNVESEAELRALSAVANSMSTSAAIAIRINPDVDAQTHAKISTGKQDNKFGVDMEKAAALYRLAASLPGIQIQGVSMHIGSQLTSLEPFRQAYRRARDFVLQLRAEGHQISVLDVGGGLGIPYLQSAEAPPDPADYGAMVREELGGLECRLVFEPGRLLVGNAGLLVSRVIYVKDGLSKKFLIVDAAMNDLLRPAMYDARHELVPVRQSDEPVAVTYDVVGPVCETGDTFEKDVSLPLLQAGDLVAFRSAGAYGAAMSGQYNSRLLTPEVLVAGEQYAIVRSRPSYEELLQQDQIASFL